MRKYSPIKSTSRIFESPDTRYGRPQSPSPQDTKRTLPSATRISTSPSRLLYNRHKFCAHDDQIDRSPNRSYNKSRYSYANDKPIYERANDLLKQKQYKLEQKRIDRYIRMEAAINQSMGKNKKSHRDKSKSGSPQKISTTRNKSPSFDENVVESILGSAHRVPQPPLGTERARADASLRQLYELKRIHDLAREEQAIRRAQILELELHNRRNSQQLAYFPDLLPASHHDPLPTYEGSYHYSPVKRPDLLPINFNQSPSRYSKAFKQELLNLSKRSPAYSPSTGVNRRTTTSPDRLISPTKSYMNNSTISPNHNNNNGSASKRDNFVYDNVKKLFEENKDEIVGFLAGLLQKRMTK